MTNKAYSKTVSGSCRRSLVVSQLSTLSAGEVHLSQHDYDQCGTECEVEGVELDWNGHGCLIEWVWKESRDWACFW